MFMCLCKALTEEDVAKAARDAVIEGDVDVQLLLSLLGVYCEEACGYCVEHPEELLRVATRQARVYQAGLPRRG